MSALQVFRMDSDGAGWHDVSDSDLFEVEDSKIVCWVCYVPLSAGQGNCCDAHANVKGSVRLT